MSDLNTNPAPPEAEKNELRRVVVLRRGKTKGSSGLRRIGFAALAVLGLLAVGTAIGFRVSNAFFEPPPLEAREGIMSERVNGGLYALEVATPRGQARWMLEFDAEIVTKDGPSNPLQLRDALEKLVIAATSLPVVNMDPDPGNAMRAAMLSIAAEHYPWLIDIYMRRSDLRAKTASLSDFGEAMRNLGQ